MLSTPRRSQAASVLRRSVLAVSLLFPAAPLAAQTNVLLVVADDLGVDQVEAYAEGTSPAPTPNLSALAANGVLFRNAWSCPSCSPTRATIMTGRHGFRTGIGFILDANSTTDHALLPSEVTLPEMLSVGTNGAWDHAAIGKWHLGNLTVGGDLAPNLAGWGHFVGTPTNLRPPDTYFSWRRVTDGQVDQANTYATTSSVDSALAFIAQSSGPWLCMLNLHAPHSPFHAPPANLHSYDLTGLNVVEHAHAYYSAMVEAIDTELGRMFSSMDPVTLAQTLVVFVGDNGTPGLPVLPPFDAARSKGSTFEGGINVPLIVSGPQVVSGGRESDALVHTVDLFATIADVANVDLGATFPGVAFDGESLLPLLGDPNAVFPRAFAYTERFAPNDPMGPPPAAACPPVGQVFCQPDVGFGGPGNLDLSMCGDQLFGGASVPLVVTGGPPNALAFLVRSEVSNPIPLYGGTLCAFPFTDVFTGMTNAQGEISLDFLAGTEPTQSYLQLAVLDPGQVQGVAFSNCVLAQTLTTHIRVVRDARYKLVVNENNCQEQLYDLLLDPFEDVELLSQGPLTSSALSHYRSLRATLAQL